MTEQVVRMHKKLISGYIFQFPMFFYLNVFIFFLLLVISSNVLPQVMMEYDPVMGGGPPFRRLFLDAMVTEESYNLEKIFHTVQKYQGNPVFTGSAPWEGWGPNIGGDGYQARQQASNVLLLHQRQ